MIRTLLIQGGGFDEKMNRKPTRAPIQNESSNGLKNTTGTIAMARLNAPDTATNQFFINVEDNKNLDAAPGRPGYAVFGRVIEGMDVVNQIKAVPVTQKGRYGDVPVDPVIIRKVTRRADAKK